MNRKAVFLSLGSMLIVAVLFVTLAGTPINTAAVEIAQVIDLQNTEQIIVEDTLALILREEVITSINNEARTGLPYSTATIPATEAQLSADVSADIIGSPASTNLRPLNQQAQMLGDAMVSESVLDAATFRFTDVQIRQSGTWTLNVQATVDYTLQKNSLNTTLSRTGRTVSTTIPLSRVLDPLMTRRLAPQDVFVEQFPVPSGTWQASHILDQANALQYLSDTHGLTYMERWMSSPRSFADRKNDFDNGLRLPGIFTLTETPIVSPLGTWSADYSSASFNPTVDCHYKLIGGDIYLPDREYVLDIDPNTIDSDEPSLNTHSFYQSPGIFDATNC